MVNMTCPTIPDKPADPKPFFANGQIDFKAHDVGWLVCGIMTLVATISSVWLIWKHLTYYTCPQQQRHIVRLLIMVPIYAIVSFMSYLFYHEALYYQTVRDCYEAVLVTSFFYLILAYTGDTRAEQHAVFRNIDLTGRFWVWPFGSWKYRPEGLHFLWLMKIWVLQYALVRPLCTFIAVGTEYFGYYCLHSWMPWFTHVWCALLISVSVSVAMYCLIQLYMPVRKLVDPYKPILKFLSIKTIVFLTFWQDTLLSFLVSFGAIKESEYFTAEQIQAGINALLQCFWMMLFGFIHIKAFSYLPYRPEDRARTTLRRRALLDSLDFRDWFFEMKESTRYMAARRKGRNYTLAEDLRAKRHEHLLNALGKQRTANLEAEIDVEKAAMPTFWKNPEDAQFWSPAEEDESAWGTNQARSSKTSSRPTSGSTDAYSALPHPVARAARPGSKVVGAQRASAGGDSHTQRAEELQRLVAELDLQDVDASALLAPARTSEEDDDEKHERAALMHPRTTPASKRDPPRTDAPDAYPELTHYHTPTIQLANVPSLSYEPETASSGGARRTHELSAVVEEDDEPAHARRGSRVAPGVGAFGIAAWLGWNGSPDAPRPGQATAYLHPDSAPQHGIASEAEGKGWWRNYWERVSNGGSREPSIVGLEDEEKEPLAASAERPAVMRQVTAGSWGQEGTPHGGPNAGARPRALPTPALQIDTDDPGHAAQRAEASEEAASPSSRISPHADSPLSRLIQTSRDSFGSLNHQDARQPPPPPPRLPLSANAEKSGETQEALGVQRVVAVRPTLAARQSVAASSKQASMSRVTSTTRSAGQSSGEPASSAYESVTSTVARELAQEMASSDSSASRHPIVFADALLPEQPFGQEGSIEVPVKKSLPPAVGPKGKLFSLVLPSPLSPARYPYGKEGNASPCNPPRQPATMSSTSQAGVVEGGSLKWASQPAKPLKPSQERTVVRAVPKLPTGKGVITVGGLSLAQTRAQAKADAEARAQAQTEPVQTPTQMQISRGGGEDAREAKLMVPAPWTLARGEVEDPYRAGELTLASAPRREALPASRQVADGRSRTTATSRSIAHTAFEVGSIITRQAIHNLPPTSTQPLNSYYTNVRNGRVPNTTPSQQNPPHPHQQPHPQTPNQHPQPPQPRTQFHFEYYRE